MAIAENLDESLLQIIVSVEISNCWKGMHKEFPNSRVPDDEILSQMVACVLELTLLKLCRGRIDKDSGVVFDGVLKGACFIKKNVVHSSSSGVLHGDLEHEASATI